MQLTRETVNMRLGEIAATLADVKLFTGDEGDPTLSFPAIQVEWLGSDLPSELSPDMRMRILQITVETVDRDTDGCEAIARAILIGLGIKYGSRTRLGTLPKKAWAVSYAGAITGTPTGSAIILRPQLGQGWRPLPSKQREGRRQVITLEAHSKPV